MNEDAFAIGPACPKGKTVHHSDFQVGTLRRAVNFKIDAKQMRTVPGSSPKSHPF
jgi:hypothetical protein